MEGPDFASRVDNNSNGEGSIKIKLKILADSMKAFLITFMSSYSSGSRSLIPLGS
jgi:hypothetical protein